MIDLPSEIYYIIAGFMNDLNSFYALSLCSHKSLIGCSKYRSDLIKKYEHKNKIGVYNKFTHGGPMFYITYPEIYRLPLNTDQYPAFTIRYDGLQTKEE